MEEQINIYINHHGQLVIPSVYRQVLGIQTPEDIGLQFNGQQLTICKKRSGCLFCNAGVKLVQIGQHSLCRFCIEKLYNAKENERVLPIKID